MRFVFLDIDGVLAPFRQTFQYKYILQDLIPPNGCLMFDSGCVAELNELCLAARASIVVSSSWRHYIPNLETMRTMLREQGVASPVSGMTPEATDNWEDCSRGAEVKHFLEGLDVEAFAILDDADMGWRGLEDKWVKTNSSAGLTREDARKAMQIMGVTFRAY